MDREQFQQFLQETVGPEAAEAMLGMFGNIEEFEVIGIDALPVEEPGERIQREAWEQMYPVTYKSDTIEGGCPDCGRDDCIGAHVTFPSYVN
jgi:hypothetical protein